MICKKDKCTGCFACYNICPKKAIKMTEDDNGFIYPEIDDAKCINCNLCEKVCPAIKKPEFKEPDKCYAMQAKKNELLSKSTSGGAATIFSEYILKNNGIVYGVAFEENFHINFIRIDTLEKLSKMKGSKYVHAYVNNAYQLAKKDLLDNKEVLFIGTPCQIAGLKKYLMKEYENLYCVDIICHGVPSQRYLKDEISVDIEPKKIDDLKFRENDEFKLRAYKDNKIVIDKEMINSTYYEGFMDSIFYRENCYQCPFAQKERISDITIGDFWGIKSDSKLYSNRKRGLSVLLPCTEKGNKLIEKCKSQMLLEERSIEEAVLGNSQLRNPSPKFKNYDKFKREYPKYGFFKAYNRSRKIKNIKKKLKKNKMIFKIYKLIKKR